MILPILDIGTPGAQCEEALGLCCFGNGELARSLGEKRKTNEEGSDDGWNVTTMKGTPNEDEVMMDGT